MTDQQLDTDNLNRNNLLEVRDLRTYFYTREGVVKAVNGVSFDAKEGETVALVGESGCGKSVTSLSVMRLISDPPGKILTGEILFEGTDILKLNEAELRSIRGKEISMIFQEPMSSLNPVLKIGDQLTESVKWHLENHADLFAANASEFGLLICHAPHFRSAWENSHGRDPVRRNRYSQVE